MEHTASPIAWFVATVARITPVVVAVDLTAVSSALVVAWMALATTKVGLVAVEVVLAVARRLEQCPENFRTESIYSHPKKWMSQAERTAQTKGRKVD